MRALQLTFMVVLATVVFAAEPVFAQSPPALSTPTTAVPPANNAPAANTWAISPTGKDPNQPSDRTTFSYELDPASSADDSLTVWNYGDADREFDVYAKDAFNTATGGIDLLVRARPSTDLGSWIAFSDQFPPNDAGGRRVHVPAHHGQTVPFSVTAPRNASPGDHDAGIVASIVTPESAAGAGKVQVDNRVGTRVFLRVKGDLHPSLLIEHIESTYHPTVNPFGRGSLEVTYTVRNAGNISLRGHETLDILGFLGIAREDRRPDDVTELLPGTSVVRNETFDGVIPALRLSSELTLTPFAPPTSTLDAAGAPQVSASTSVWAIPWTLISLLLAAISGCILFRRWRRNRTSVS